MPALHSLHYRVHTRAFITLVLALAMVTVMLAESPHRALLREADAAQKAGDAERFIGKLEAARALRPDYPRGILLLARAYAAANRPVDALAALRSLADLGVTLPIEQDRPFAALRALPEFTAVARALASNAQPRGSATPAFSLTGQSGIIESLARDARGSWYFSDAHHRCLWRRDAAGALTRFSHDDDRLLGVFGLRVDDRAGVIWAGTSALPEMSGYTDADQGRAALVQFDLATGRVRHAFNVPADGRAHLLGDVYLTADGSVFASDSSAPIVWRLAPGAEKLERWLESDDFVNLQGMTAGADGRSLIVADYLNGLWKISLSDKSHALLPVPANSTLFGIDGLYTVPGGLVATQNGNSPLRVIRIDTDADDRPTGLQVLASGHENMSDVSLGTIADGHLYFIGNSGWSLFEKAGTKPTTRTVDILQTSLQPPASP